MKKLPLLMTASVDTLGMKGACFSALERENMYIDAINSHINRLLMGGGVKIVFVENSGWDLSKMREKANFLNNNNIEFISLSPDLFDISKGKGYNEVLLIHYAIHQSNFICDAGAFFKVTGRYPIFNIKYFVDYASKAILTSKEKKKLYIDIKDHPVYDWLKLGWCGHSAEVRLFGCENNFFEQNIYSQCNELNDYDGHLLEELMFNVVKRGKKKDIIDRFKKEPHFGGIEGSNINAVSFSKKQNSFKGKFKRMIGNLIRIFFPFFKF